MNGSNNLPPGWGGDSNAQSPWGAAPQSPVQSPAVPQAPAQPPAATQSPFRQPSEMPKTASIPNMNTPLRQSPAPTSSSGRHFPAAAVALIAIGAVGIGVGGAFALNKYLSKENTNTSQRSSEENPLSPEQTAETQTKANTEVEAADAPQSMQEAMQTNAAVTDIAPAASELGAPEATVSATEKTVIAQKNGSVKMFSASDAKTYQQFLNVLNQRVSDGTYNAFGTLESYGYALCDINQDNTPELIVAYMPTYREDSSYVVEIFCISSNQVYSITQNMHNSFLGLTNKGFITSGGFCPDGSITYYKYEGTTRISEWDTVSSDLDWNDNFSYTQRDQTGTHSITEQEFNEIMKSYGDTYDLSLTPLKNIVSKQQGNSGSSDENSNDPKWEYKDTSNLIAIGKATPIGNVLSIRPYKSDDAEALIKMPKGSYVGIISIEDDWMYVKYYVDYDSPIIYGYVRANKIEVTKYY